MLNVSSNGGFSAQVPPGTYTILAVTPNTAIPIDPPDGKMVVSVEADEVKEVKFEYRSVTGN